ncbi:hypothetical protein PoB_003277200 [Plakobranchus ocellatus]|uniref:Uncharacterized protein n=1 Tax=Plakobranchus ocellatus TaxID=259542 RepID=A0AAV4AH81_9GAST|nr:hypothetical protein PoB_003277200 [Plakobranchus ocellatus]
MYQPSQKRMMLRLVHWLRLRLWRQKVVQLSLIRGLSSSQVQDVKDLLIEFQDILTSVPGYTSTICHEIRLTTDADIRVKPYPLPFAAREFVT